MTTNERQSDEPQNKKPRNFTEKTWAVSIVHGCNIIWWIFAIFVDFIIKRVTEHQQLQHFTLLSISTHYLNSNPLTSLYTTFIWQYMYLGEVQLDLF